MACVADPREAEQIVYAEYVRCAEEGLEAAKIDDLCHLLGGAAASTPPMIQRRLEMKGLIRVKRWQRTKQVFIVASGQWTKEPSNKVPHWRDVPRAPNLPTVSIHTVAEQRQNDAMFIQQEARRQGKMPADFILDLIHRGLCDYRAEMAEQELAEAA